MNSRRKFLLQGSMATTALLAAKPFKTFSNSIAPATGFSIKGNKVVLVHTGDYMGKNQHQTHTQIAGLKKNIGGVVLLHAGNDVKNKVASMNYDASISPEKNILFTENNYRMLYKGDIKIGVINAIEGENDIINKLCNLSAYLKKEKNCHMVVCLSQLGYKNKNRIDDTRLAENSSSLDVIIGGHPSNYFAHTVIAANRNKEEVIIHFASGNGFDFGNIEVCFDEAGNKRSVAINNLISRTT
jgi:hypothetical protein